MYIRRSQSCKKKKKQKKLSPKSSKLETKAYANPGLRWLTTVMRRKNIKILKSVKLKQNDVSCEVLVTAIDVKCNFT